MVNARLSASPPPAICATKPRGSPPRAGQCRQQHEREDHRQVLDDEPADRDPAVDRVERVAFFQGTQEDDRTGLATDSASPSTIPAPRLQPQLSDTAAPMAVATTI